MGGYFDDAQRHIVVGAGRAIIDREINTPANTYFVAVGPSQQQLGKAAFTSLRNAASQGQGPFDTVAATEITFWPTLSTAERDDLYSVFLNVPSATRSLEVHCGQPHKQQFGTFLTAGEEQALLASAQNGASAFGQSMMQIAPTWWASLYADLRDAFWLNYQED